MSRSKEIDTFYEGKTRTGKVKSAATAVTSKTLEQLRIEAETVRDAALRQQAERKLKKAQRRNNYLRRKGITPAQTAQYHQLRKEFLAQNPWCAVGLLRREKIPATLVHHRKGRARHFLDASTFVAVSAAGDKWIHANEAEARRLGLLE